MVYNTQRGDTLVEVLMAVVIISLVIVGAITMMSRGLAAAQVALEHSQVRSSVNGQIEMLRYARDSFIKNRTDPSAQQWSAIVATSNTNPISYNDSCTISGGKNGFYMSKNASQITRTTYAAATPQTVAVPGAGLWIEALTSDVSVKPAYVDFVIRACWAGAGAAGKQQTVTALRLYDPAR